MPGIHSFIVSTCVTVRMMSNSSRNRIAAMDTSSREPSSDYLLICFFLEEAFLTSSKELSPLVYTAMVGNCVGEEVVLLT